MEQPPKVSIGLPVYNGANFLAEALSSILGQTFGDFEVIISDNASTDHTSEICKIYEQKDSRIHYYRNEKNLGASKNFNKTFELSKGEYFKWAAHDDVLEPAYLESCIDILENHKDVVLCYPQSLMIFEETNERISCRNEMILPEDTPHERFHHFFEYVRPGKHNCHPVFGVIRSDILQRTALIDNFASSDRTLLGELSLYGKFYEIPETLFHKRYHKDMSIIANPTITSKAGWYDPQREGKLQLVAWCFLRAYFRSVLKARLSFRETLLCLWEVFKWSCRNSHWLIRNVLKFIIWPFLSPQDKIQRNKIIKEDLSGDKSLVRD